MFRVAFLTVQTIYFFYGLAFIVLGLVVIAQPKQGSTYEIGRYLWLLAGFGFTHGTKEWIDFWGEAKLPMPDVFHIFGQVLLLASFVFLIEFGRRMTMIGVAKFAEKKARSTSLLVSVSLIFAVVIAIAIAEKPITAANVWSRYFIGFPAGLLTGIAFVRYYRLIRNDLSDRKVGYAFYASGAAFALYGILSGIVVAPQNFFPGNVINTDAFLSAIGAPVQLFRALCAIVAAVAVATLLRLFHHESRARLKNAIDQANSAYQRLNQVSEQNQLILNSTQDAIIGVGEAGDLNYVNRAGKKYVNFRTDREKPQSLVEVFQLKNGHPMLAAFDRVRDQHVSVLHQPARVTVNDKEIDIEFTLSPAIENMKFTGAVLTFSDVSARLSAERQMRIAEQVMRISPQGVLVTDQYFRIRYVNPAIVKMSGYEERELIGQTPNIFRSGYHDDEFYKNMREIIKRDGRWQGEIWNRRKNGDAYPEWLVVIADKDSNGSINHYVAIYADMSAQEQMQQRLYNFAYYDALTGLPNRQLLRDRMDRAIAHATREQSMVAVIFLDVDRFKMINESMGHSTGDHLLMQIADRLQKCVREEDTVARLGGDEFAVVVPFIHSEANTSRMVDTLFETLRPAFKLDGREVFSPSTLGVAIFPSDGKDGDTLLRNAETAMHRAKELGRNTVHYYSEELSTRSQKRLLIENELHKAVGSNQFFLVYQPQVAANTNRTIGVEALIRWQHPVQGLISPLDFIPIAEDTGLIQQIGEWVIQRACEEGARWLHIPDFKLSVNVSGQQIRKLDFAKLVEKILRKTNFPSCSLEIELTESVLMNNADIVVNNLNQLSELGVSLAIDDFGTGYSSLSYLKRFSVNKLKIDRSFVRDIPGDNNDAAIASTIIAMGRALGLVVTAEGVETIEQRDFLLSEGCHYLQGYLFSKPVDCADVIIDFNVNQRDGKRSA